MNIALIGLGMVSETHVAAIRASNDGLKLAGVLGRDPERTAAFAEVHRTLPFQSLKDVANDPDIDFVILATPPDARADLVRELAGAGKPILMEKPVERTLAAASVIVETCDAAKVPLGVVFQHRARAASQALKNILTNGELGQIATVEIRVPWWREQSYYDAPGRGSYARDGGGVMISQAIHTLDLAIWLLGPISAVQSMMRTTPVHTLEAEDWAGALFEMQCGACGSLMASTAAFPGGAESIAIHGTKGSARLESGVVDLSFHDGRTETIGAAATTGGGADPMAFTHAWHQSVIEDFARSLREGSSPMCPGREALRAHAVIDAMEAANRSGRRTEVTPI